MTNKQYLLWKLIDMDEKELSEFLFRLKCKYCSSDVRYCDQDCPEHVKHWLSQKYNDNFDPDVERAKEFDRKLQGVKDCATRLYNHYLMR